MGNSEFINCVSVSNMRESDRKTIERHVPGLTLMYRAAMGVFLSADWNGETVIAAGSGNNGGDGFALSCILKEHGFDCRVVTLSDRRTPDSAHFEKQAAILGVPVASYESGCFSGCDIIVDCLLGTGFAGEVREPYASCIREINSAGAYVICVDINSGMNGDTGEWKLAVKSDLTVAVGFLKNGMMTDYAGRIIKRLVCADIGIVLDKQENRVYAGSEWCDDLERRGDAFRCPDYLSMTPIDVSGIAYEGEKP